MVAGGGKGVLADMPRAFAALKDHVGSDLQWFRRRTREGPSTTGVQPHAACLDVLASFSSDKLTVHDIS